MGAVRVAMNEPEARMRRQRFRIEGRAATVANVPGTFGCETKNAVVIDPASVPSRSQAGRRRNAGEAANV
jgi:hypothetical protein